MQLVILAGGKGTRLGLTDIPKPMCPIMSKPVLEYQIELAKKYGITEIFLLTGYLANVIEDYFGDGSKWGVKLHHIVETNPLGTAGNFPSLKDKLKDRFMVFYGDIVMDFDLNSFINFDKQNDSLATILVHPNNHPYDSDLVEIDDKNRVTNFLSKPHPDDLVYKNLVNAAIYIFSPEVLNFIEKDIPQDFGKDILPKILKSNKNIFAYHSAEYIKDMGTPERLIEISDDIKNGKISLLSKTNQRPAIFLDRDGVLCQDMDTKPTVDNFQLLPQVPSAIKLINQSSYLSIIVTNQPMIAKGFVTFQEVYQTNKTLETQLGKENCFIDGIYICPHHPDKGFDGEVKELKINCDCRKPKPGMLLKAQKDFNIDLHQSWMIGDRESDLQAGKNAGCKTVLVGNTIKNSALADHQFKNLFEAVNFILKQNDNN